MHRSPIQPNAAALPRSRAPRRVSLATVVRAVWLGFLLLPFGLRAADAPATLEYKVKAGYLFNFAKFIEWPAGAYAAVDSPFVIGVLDGADALAAMQTVLAGKLVDGHPVQVRAVAADQIGKDLQLLFVSRTGGKTPEELQQDLGPAATLVVGETDEFAERGGMIGFIREKETVRFNLNLERAADAGLKVSSKLSNVAKQVTLRRKR